MAASVLAVVKDNISGWYSRDASSTIPILNGLAFVTPPGKFRDNASS
jgi:hypothetical protein